MPSTQTQSPRRRANSLISRLRAGIEARVELSIAEWAGQLNVSEASVYVLLAQLRRDDGFHAHSVVRDSGKKAVVQLDREPRNDEEADEFARLADGVSIRYSKDINCRLNNVLNAMGNCAELYPLLEQEVKKRLIETAQLILQYDYENFQKLVDGYRETYQLVEGGSESAATQS